MKKIGNKAVVAYIEGYLLAISDIYKPQVKILPYIKYFRTKTFDFNKFIKVENINAINNSFKESKANITDFEKWLEFNLNKYTYNKNISSLLSFKIVDEIQIGVFNNLYSAETSIYSYQELDKNSNNTYKTDIFAIFYDSRCLIIGFSESISGSHVARG